MLTYFFLNLFPPRENLVLSKSRISLAYPWIISPTKGHYQIFSFLTNKYPLCGDCADAEEATIITHYYSFSIATENKDLAGVVIAQ